MDKILQGLLNWEKIEELERSESKEPGTILGAHVKTEGLLLQAYLPNAKSVTVKIDGKERAMEPADTNGFFAVLLADLRENMREDVSYELFAEYENGDTETIEDPYSGRFGSIFTEEEIRKFNAGTYYNSYEKMGAHPMTMDGVEGVHFAVWAPNAMRVSVVGDFNFWDGRRHQMNLLKDCGIYELFIPGLKPGITYKYEIKTPKAEPMLKADPYAFCTELRPASASVVWENKPFAWTDEMHVEFRSGEEWKESPMSIYELHAGSWRQKPVAVDADGNNINGSQFYNYRELAGPLSDMAHRDHFDCVQLMPVMEHPLDASWGYEVIGYYAPTSRFGTPDDFKAFVNQMHEEGISVILDWVPAHFPRDGHGLAAFDGTCLYEYEDPRRGNLEDWGTLRFNYGRPQVSNFLISNALYWVKEFHVDGLHIGTMASMLYLDYGKRAGEWEANIYGGNENLEAVEFLKHLSSIFHREAKGAILTAEESTAWPQITGDLKEGGLGFDFKWNVGWTNDFLRYMKCGQSERSERYSDLTFGMLYNYSDDFILSISHDDVSHGKGSMLGKMPGDTREEKEVELRAAYGFMLGHPGKKLLFMGQEFGQADEWSETKGLSEKESHDNTHLKEYVTTLNRIYHQHPALYEMDYEPEGFQWINCTSDKDNLVVFARYSKDEEDTVVFACNFSREKRENFRMGVPHAGKYKEILNSDAEEFGGSGLTNEGALESEAVECDSRPNSLTITLPPSGVCVFHYEMEKKEEMPDEKDADAAHENERRFSGFSDLSIDPVQIVKAAGGALAERGAGALDRLSETVGNIINKTKQ